MNTWLTSDPHFGHSGVCRFLNSDGSKLRPWDNPDDMDEALVSNWNSVVSPKDRVYCLGDVVINRRCLPTIGRLNGRKILILGNHDIFRSKEYLEYFDDLRAYWPLDGFMMSHIPMHPDSLYRWKANIHGHLHSNRVLKADGTIDPKYISVCVEQTNWTPIDFEEIRSKFKESVDSSPETIIIEA